MTTNRTMGRSFDPRDLVLLPVLDARSAVALGQMLVTRAKTEELAEPVAQSLRRMKEAHAELRDAARARLTEAPAARVDRRKAHSAEAAAFGAMHRWLDGWAQVPQEFGREKTLEARRLMAALFAGGLKFLQLPYDAGWAEADLRVRWLEEHDAGEWFDELGGGELLQYVRSTHKKYGEVLGITKEQALPAATPVRVQLLAFCDRLRDYVVQVAADASGGGDASRELARRLLAPLAQWHSKRASRPAAQAPEVASAAAPPPA